MMSPRQKLKSVVGIILLTLALQTHTQAYHHRQNGRSERLEDPSTSTTSTSTTTQPPPPPTTTKTSTTTAAPPEDPNAPFKRISSSINKFSNRLYNTMNEYEHSEDLVYSPITVFTSLSTLQSGASHETKSELSTILSLSRLNDTVIQDGLNAILDTFKTREDVSSVNLINRVFLDHSFHPTNAYVNSVRDKLHGELVQTHFSNATAASLFVNNHVYVASHGVLHDIIAVEPPQQDNNVDHSVTEISVVGNASVSSQQALVIDGGLMLVSGLTFEGDWDRPFTPLLTRPSTFHSEDGTTSEIDMMHRDGVYFHAEIPELNASALSIPYKTYRYSLTILLPEPDISIPELEHNLESFPCIAVLSRLQKRYMQVSLPRFQVESTIDLIDPLEKLGVRRVFSDESAQFRRLVDGVAPGELFLTNALHKVLFDVREGGSRVSSQNFIEAVPAQARVLTPFLVNRPFVFFVSDQLLNSIVLVGRKTA